MPFSRILLSSEVQRKRLTQVVSPSFRIPGPGKKTDNGVLTYIPTVAAQVNELNIVRQALYQLENQHREIRQQYEEEIRSLRSELSNVRQQQQQSQQQQPQPPPTVVPPPPTSYQDGYYSRGRDVSDRDRDRDRDRERERAERERSERDRDRERDQRDTKRIKTERLKDRPGTPLIL